MDPTAPNDNPQSPNSSQKSSSPADESANAPSNTWSSPESTAAASSGLPSQNIDGAIEPGQFVITGNETANPAQPVVQPPQPSDIQMPAAPQSSFSINPPTLENPQPSPALPPIENQFTPPPPTAQEPTVQSPITSQTQPDPTPFVPPTAGAAASSFSKQPGGVIKKLRILILFLGIIILLLIIGVAVWFFFLSNKSNQAARTQDQSQSPTIEQPALPRRTQGGFDQLNQSTSSTQPQEATATAPIPPTP